VLITTILRFEANGANRSGVEIDRVLADAARDDGYSDEDVFRLLHPNTKRTVFENEGDWAKAQMTYERLHKVVSKAAYCKGKVRHQCNVYQITPTGLDELRKRS
jgi:hypothetical protein